MFDIDNNIININYIINIIFLSIIYNERNCNKCYNMNLNRPVFIGP